jgi:DNA polymerase III epsilon subunit-like protein
MLEELWKRNNSFDSYPFSIKHRMDMMQIELFLDYCKDKKEESVGYSLNAMIKKYGIKNEASHTAEYDVKATKDLFLKQIDLFKKALNK